MIDKRMSESSRPEAISKVISEPDSPTENVSKSNETKKSEMVKKLEE